MTKRVFATLLSIVVLHAGVHAQSDGNMLRSYISAAEVAMNNENPGEAIAHLKNAANIAPDNFVPFYLLGQAYLYVEDNDNAAKHYTEALNLVDANTISQKYYECFGTAENISYREITTSIYEALAEHYRNTGQTGLAKRYNNLNIQLNIASGYKAPVSSSLAQIYLCYAEEGEWNDCLEYFKEILMVIPHGGAWGMCESVCHAALGDCYAYLGQEGEMISEYQQAARLGHSGAMQALKNAGISY